jgi:type I restriction enzyme, S subunit
VKQGWIEQSLGGVCTVQSGAGFPIKYQGSSEGQYPFFKVSDMNLEGNEEVFESANNYISEEVRSKLGARIFPKGSVLFPKVGGAIATNKKRRANRPSCADNNIMGLIPDTSLVHEDFLFHWMIWQDIYEFSNKANPPSITQATVNAWPFLLPPLDEQKRIVAVLDQAFAALDRARGLAEANLTDAQELLDIELVDIFNRVDGDDIHSISSVFATATGATPPKSDDSLYGEDIRFVKPPELLNGLVDETRDGLSEAARPKARLAPAGAVLVSCIGNLGKIGLLDREAAFNQQINAILPNAKIARPDFIYWQCRSRPFRDQLEARSSGTTIPIVNKKQFNSIPVWLPTLGEQDRVSKRLDETERNAIALRNLYEEKLENLDDLRQSLLQRAFAGQL